VLDGTATTEVAEETRVESVDATEVAGRVLVKWMVVVHAEAAAELLAGALLAGAAALEAVPGTHWA